MEKQVVSKKRVADHGEVYTATREVNAMLDLVKHECERIESRFLEPACGTGNFLAEILERKLRVVGFRYPKRQLDFERNAVFPGVDFEGGVCFFLWDRDNESDCDVTTFSGDEVVGPVLRNLSEFDVFVRDIRALKILRKVINMGEASITEILSVDKEFGWTSNFDGFHTLQQPNDVALHYNRKGKRLVGWINRKDVGKSPHLIDKWKVMIPQAYGERGSRPATVLGPSFIAVPPSVCTQTYLFFYVSSKRKAISLNSYLRTRFFRFFVSLRKITQHATRSTYTWVPLQTWDRIWTDEALYRKYSLNQEEIAFIESRIRPMEGSDE